MPTGVDGPRPVRRRRIESASADEETYVVELASPQLVDRGSVGPPRR